MILIGTSGWQYRDWRGRLYPPGLPQRAWLSHYARRFATVEVNNAFYRLPERDTFARWRQQTPDDFVMAVKMSRFLTHVRRLRDPEQPVDRFLDHAAGLGTALGPVLLQLPPTMTADPPALSAVLDLLTPRVRVAVEPRHRSWWTPTVRDCLSRHGAALCWADRGGRPVTPLWRTTSFGYLRLHGGRARGVGYGRRALTSWLDRLTAFADPADVFVFFNNDQGGAAVADATTLAGLAARHGRVTSRVPDRADAHLGRAG